MIEVVEVEPVHFEKIVLRKYEKQTLEAFHAELHHIMQVAVMGPAYTVLCKGEVLAIAGIAMLWGKVGEAWLLSSTSIEKYGSAAAKAVIKKMAEVEAELGNNLTRLQASAPVSHPSAHRWLEWLGLEYESTAKKYSVTGEDCVIYAKVKNGN